MEELERRLSWSAGRAVDALDSLLEASSCWYVAMVSTSKYLIWLIKELCLRMQEGLAMIDDGDKDGKRRYWFPCVSSISSVTGADAIAV